VKGVATLSSPALLDRCTRNFLSQLKSVWLKLRRLCLECIRTIYLWCLGICISLRKGLRCWHCDRVGLLVDPIAHIPPSIA